MTTQLDAAVPKGDESGDATRCTGVATRSAKKPFGTERVARLYPRIKLFWVGWRGRRTLVTQ